MAKMKPEFENIVENSFNDGFNREPEIIPQQEPQKIEIPEGTPENPTPETLSENEILLKKLRMGERDAIDEALNHTERATHFITDLQRECINVKSRIGDMTKQEVVQAALNKYFDERIVEEAKREVIRKRILRLEKEVEAGMSK